MTRRSALAVLSASASAHPQRMPGVSPEIVARNDEIVTGYLERQNTDPNSRWRGAIPDAFGLHEPGSASGILANGVAALVHPQSRFHADAELRRRLHLAADHLKRVQTPDGNVDLLITNFNSPPDTAFVMHNVAMAASLAQRHGEHELLKEIEPFMRTAGAALARGGVHTPNHRWVVCAALAQIHAVFPDQAYLARIDQWLAEGIDIDEDGQYSEQSTTVYNAVSNNALVTVADKLSRPRLLEPVRRNLEAMLHLLHPGNEVVTEISHRQDRNAVGDMGRYWFALRYLSRRDGDGRYETLARAFEPRSASLARLMDFPLLLQQAPEPEALPDDYERAFPNSKLVHIRRGETSASIILEGNSRFFALRRGAAVINGVRFASAFFGKAQFVADRGAKRGDAYRLEQSLEAPYVQPFEPAREQPWGVESWYKLRPQRRTSEVATLRYEATIEERRDGFDLRISADGTDWVPLAVEINFREGGEFEGVEPAPGAEEAYLLTAAQGVYRRDGDEIRFGPGIAETRYTQVRGALPKLDGPSVYLTAYTPFERTIRFRWSA